MSGLSSSHQESEEVLKRRQAGFARMARIAKAVNERQRLDLIEEDNVSSKSSQYWLTENQQLQRQVEQLSYTKPYLAEYKSVDPLDNDDESSSREHVSALPSVPDHNSTPDFDATSTIMVPSEWEPENNPSALDPLELKRDYFTNYKTNTQLPIYKSRTRIISCFKSYSTTIIEGATGCGKTTQVPLYILEESLLERKNPRSPVVYVTQPRKIAARSIAQRVCDEHGWNLGDFVGYQVGLDKVTSARTSLVFCTSGVLLQKLIAEKSLQGYTHIIIDEAHERDADTDLLMMMIRTLMRREQSQFRLIVMSATIDMTKLKNYFSYKTSFGHRNMTIPSICRIGLAAKPTEIQVIYYDKLRSAYQIEDENPPFDDKNAEVLDECVKAAVKIIMDVIPYFDTYGEDTKSTLVFLPGLAEIQKLHKMLEDPKNRTNNQRLDIIPLHSCLSTTDQHRVFRPSDKGIRKVILATNIAESSITVKDVGFIIDFCLTKCLMKDPITKFPTLNLQWCSQDRCVQRAGRTGRCCPGKVFRLVTSDFYQKLDPYAKPELLLTPLELSVLRVKNFEMGEVKALLAVVLDPPPLDEIRTAVMELKQIGALSATYRGKLSDVDGDLTQLGRVISALPIDVHLSKLIVIASLLDVLDDAIIVAACLSTNRSVTKHLYGRILESYENKLRWANGSHSDLFVSLAVYKDYLYQRNDLGRSQNALEKWCNNLYLDDRKLHEVSSLVEELTHRLEGVNIMSHPEPNRKNRQRCEDELMLKVAFCAAFYPNYFISQELDPQSVDRELHGFDPAKTLVLTGFPNNQAALYYRQVMSQMKTILGDEFALDYLADNSKALLIFHDTRSEDVKRDEAALSAIGLDGIVEDSKRIPKSVYLAIKMQDSDQQLIIDEYCLEAALDRAPHYHNSRILRTSRLVPPLSKIISDRQPDNSGLLMSTDEEYERYIKDNNYVEVAYNSEQDAKDLELMSRKRGGSEVPSSEWDKSLYVGKKILKGPSNPTQMKFQSVLEKSQGYGVDVDMLSVNSVLLDPNYEKSRRQMLVAASVGQNRRNRIIVRDTTLMPNIRGLPTIMSLLFAQYYRFIYNDQMKCISGAVFGVGWNESEEPLDRDYEVELNFDVQITKNDVNLLNEARRRMSELIQFLEIANPGAPQKTRQQELRATIMTLIRTHRYPIHEISMNQTDWSRSMFRVESSRIFAHQFSPLKEGEVREFLPLIPTDKVFDELDLFRTIRENLELVERFAKNDKDLSDGSVRCLLCGGGVGYAFVSYFRAAHHLDSNDHRDNLKKMLEGEIRATKRASLAHVSCTA